MSQRPRPWMGKRFGRLVVTGYEGNVRVCLCDCGTEHRVDAANMKATRSCGCLKRETHTTHGGSGLPEYSVWEAMIARCENPRNKYYYNYGGRGIRVCPRWRKSFKSFYQDVGARPSLGHSLEREENDGNYEPGNVRWATRSEQMRNTRVTRFVIFEERRWSIADLADRAGVDHSTMKWRIKMWPASDWMLRRGARRSR